MNEENPVIDRSGEVDENEEPKEEVESEENQDEKPE